MNNPKLTVSVTDFRTLIKKGGYYVDKTSCIKDIVEHQSRVIQIIRPHGFGKSLGLSTLYYFLTNNMDGKEFNGETAEHKTIFSSLNVYEDDFFCSEFMGQYPVIHISFHHASFHSFELTHSVLCSTIVNLAKSFSFLAASKSLDLEEKVKYGHLTDYYHLVNNYTDLSLSLYELTRLLSTHFGRQVFLLIDDIDTPLSAASKFGYYTEMGDLISHMLTAAINHNNYLYKAIIISYLHLSSSVNLSGCHISDLKDQTPALHKFFGFSSDEAFKMISDCAIKADEEEVREWYGGYTTGEDSLLTPSSIVNFCAETLDTNLLCIISKNSYWMEQNRNHNFYEFLSLLQSSDAAELKKLIGGESSVIKENPWITYQDLNKRGSDGYWNFLLATGYLASEEQTNSEQKLVKIKIPNREVNDFILNQIKIYFSSRNEIFCKNARHVLNTIIEGNESKVENALNWCLKTYICTDKTSALEEYARFVSDHLMIYYESSISYISCNDPKFSAEKSKLSFIYDSDQYGSEQIGVVLLIDLGYKKESAVERAEKLLKDNENSFDVEPMKGSKFIKKLLYALVFCDGVCVCKMCKIE